MKAKLTIATRGSQLALWQSRWIREQILESFPHLDIVFLILKTVGDQILDHPLAKIGGKGLFVKELEQALLLGDADLAVHSMKDVPVHLPEGLEISVITPREDPSDALISPLFSGLIELPAGAVLGTSSLRRMAQLRHHRPDLQFKTLRGNVDTRLQKVLSGDFDAIVLATAGLKRMGLDQHITQRLPFDIMLPAIAQGAIGIETRIGDHEVLEAIQSLRDSDTTACVMAERTALATMDGSCQIPIAGHCRLHQGILQLTALVAHPETGRQVSHMETAPVADAEALGRRVGTSLLMDGGSQILQEIILSSSPNPY